MNYLLHHLADPLKTRISQSEVIMRAIAALLVLLLAYVFAFFALATLISFPIVWLASISLAWQSETELLSPIIMIAGWIGGTLFWLLLAKGCAYLYKQI